MPSISSGSSDYLGSGKSKYGFLGFGSSGLSINNNSGTYGGNNTGSSYANPFNGGINTNSGEAAYISGFKPAAAGMVGGTKGHLGQTLSYNPFTGEQEWVNSTFGTVIGSGNSGPGGPGTLTYKDPKTGMTTINQSVLTDFLSKLGVGGGGGGITAAQSSGGTFTPKELDPIDPFEQFQFQQQAVDPSDVIAKSQYAIDENMDKDFAMAGKQFGKTGWGMSTGYTNNLGNAARRASQDTGKLIAGYQYDAAKHASDQFQEQQMQQAEAAKRAWELEQTLNQQAGMFTGSQSFQDYLAQMQNDQFNTGQTNTVNMHNQDIGVAGSQSQMDFLSQLLGGLF